MTSARRLTCLFLHRILARKGVDCQRAGNLKEALKCYIMALHLDKTNVEALTAKGALHTKLCVQCAFWGLTKCKHKPRFCSYLW